MESTRPRLYRSSNGALAGVATGLAFHLGISVVLVRLAFLALMLLNGLGATLYLGYWAVVPLDKRAPAEPRLDPRPIAGVVAVFAVVTVALSSMSPRTFVPALLVGGGLVLVWRQADAGRSIRAGRVPLAVGGVLLLAGLGTFVAATARAGQPVVVFGATLVALVTAAFVGWPWWQRLVTELGAERRARVRTHERAEVAAHLHDSVLQTLTLIQRNVGSPDTVRSLARRQERELRDWLAGRPPAGEATVAGAMQAAADEVEDGYGIVVDLVTVGDAPVDDRLGAMVQAAREAMVNAARHSGCTTVSAYVEVEPNRATAYVRDRGMGFDPAGVPEGRYGVAQSIVGRMARHGGRATIESAPGEGTEVALELEW